MKFTWPGMPLRPDAEAKRTKNSRSDGSLSCRFQEPGIWPRVLYSSRRMSSCPRCPPGFPISLGSDFLWISLTRRTMAHGNTPLIFGIVSERVLTGHWSCSFLATWQAGAEGSTPSWDNCSKHCLGKKKSMSLSIAGAQVVCSKVSCLESSLSIARKIDLLRFLYLTNRERVYMARV